MIIPLMAILLQSAAAPAPPAGRQGQPPATMTVEPLAMAIAAWDGDGDGAVTRAELTTGIARSFAAIEAANTGGTAATGRLGYIGYGDWARRWLGDANALPSPFTIDTNGDNAITIAELQAQFSGLFDRLDVDRDGRLLRHELLTIRAQAGGGERERGGRNGKRSPR